MHAEYGLGQRRGRDMEIKIQDTVFKLFIPYYTFSYLLVYLYIERWTIYVQKIQLVFCLKESNNMMV